MRPENGRKGEPRDNIVGYGAGEHRLDFIQTTTGRRVGRRCVAPTNANRKNPSCTRIATIGSLSVHGHAGRNTFIFTGRIQGKALKPGPYTVVAATAADARKGLYAAAPFRERR